MGVQAGVGDVCSPQNVRGFQDKKKPETPRTYENYDLLMLRASLLVSLALQLLNLPFYVSTNAILIRLSTDRLDKIFLLSSFGIM